MSEEFRFPETRCQSLHLKSEVVGEVVYLAEERVL